MNKCLQIGFKISPSLEISGNRELSGDEEPKTNHFDKDYEDGLYRSFELHDDDNDVLFSQPF